MPILTFNEDDHSYFADGKRVPGVNEIMESVGVQDFSRNQGDPEEYFQRGNYVHDQMSMLLTIGLNWYDVDPRYVGYLRAGEKFIKDTGFKAICVEKPLYHPVWNYAGTSDVVGTVTGGRVILPDYKTGAVTQSVKWQTAGYGELYDVNGICKVSERYGLQLMENGKYKLSGPWIEYRDVQEWYAFVTAYHKQKVRIKNGECVWK